MKHALRLILVLGLILCLAILPACGSGGGSGGGDITSLYGKWQIVSITGGGEYVGTKFKFNPQGYCYIYLSSGTYRGSYAYDGQRLTVSIRGETWPSARVQWEGSNKFSLINDQGGVSVWIKVPY